MIRLTNLAAEEPGYWVLGLAGRKDLGRLELDRCCSVDKPGAEHSADKPAAGRSEDNPCRSANGLAFPD